MFLAIVITAAVAFVGGGYVGWLYGKKAQAAVQAAVSKVDAAASAIKKA